MKKLKAGFIGFIPFTAKGDEFYEHLKVYADMGYRGFENAAALFDGDVDENLARVRDMGMEPIDVGYGRAMQDLGTIIERAHKINVTRVVAFDNLASAWRFGARPEPASYDEVMGEIEEFERIATALRAEGLDFMYHNHDVEFTQCYRGVPQLLFIAANSDNIKFELDCGWASFAGVDPARLIHKLGSRISALHIKDYTGEIVEYPRMPHVKAPQFTAPGSGKLDLRGCLEAGVQEGQEWAIVEQDMLNHLTSEQTLATAYGNMKETGFVE